MNATTSRQAAAIEHLRLLPYDRNPQQDIYYVQLAYTYGVEVDQIAEASGLHTSVVQTILRGPSPWRGSR